MIQADNTKTKKAATSAGVIARRIDKIRAREDWFRLIRRIVIICIIGWILFSHVLLVTQMKGQDMFPSVKDGDLVIAYRLQKEYVKGDIVVCEIDGRQYIGRIVANATDVVNIGESGTLVVNGTLQSGEIVFPTYAKDSVSYPYRVPEGHVFLLGDHRTESTDSRDFGPVPVEKVLGKVLTILRRREI